MLTVKTFEDKNLLINRTNIAAKNRSEVPCGYITADEWLTRSKKNISEIFRKYEQGIL